MQIQQTGPRTPQPKSPKRFWIRLAFFLVAILCLLACGLVWILNIGHVIVGAWSVILPILFAILAVVFSLCQWLFPFPSGEINASALPPFSSPVHSSFQSSAFKSAPPIHQNTPLERLWNVPFLRNPFFTGREHLLEQLHTRLLIDSVAALTQAQSISGLGGIGKTQIALEYAYRYQSNYQAVLWVNAASHEALLADFGVLAMLLGLPEQHEPDQQQLVQRVKHWFATHDRWLLILDNADDLSLLGDYLPTGSDGHLLLTTRVQSASPLATNLQVQKMETEEAVALLLRRAGLLPAMTEVSLQQRAQAEAIVTMLDGLPLAIDQAGAYIEETSCTLGSYREQYQQRQFMLLERRGGTGTDYPKSVATTWALSFTQVRQQNAVASDLLRLCAFLDPDAIPEELLLEGAAHLGPNLRALASHSASLDEAIGVLGRFSLLQRDRDSRQLTIHRLVQVVLKASMNDKLQRTWAKRAIRAVNHVFPISEIATWVKCRRLLPHAQACAVLVAHYHFMFPETATLLNKAANYLHDLALYQQAEPLCQRALAIREQRLGPEHPDTAQSLNTLTLLYRTQGKYEQAEPLAQRALAIRERQLGPMHPNTAISLNNLAELYRVCGKYEQAELFAQRALAIRGRVLGPEHPDTAQSLNNLAELYRVQGKYEEAEPLAQRALAIREQGLGPLHPETAISLNNLAELYRAQGKYEEADPLYQRALAIIEQRLGPHHPTTQAIEANYTTFLQLRNRKTETAKTQPPEHIQPQET